MGRLARWVSQNRGTLAKSRLWEHIAWQRSIWPYIQRPSALRPTLSLPFRVSTPCLLLSRLCYAAYTLLRSSCGDPSSAPPDLPHLGKLCR